MYEEYRPLAAQLDHMIRQERRPLELQRQIQRDGTVQTFLWEAQRKALDRQRQQVQVRLASNTSLAACATVQVVLTAMVNAKPYGVKPLEVVVTVAA